MLLREAVLTKIVNRAFYSGEAYIADGEIQLRKDSENTQVLSSSSLPSFPGQKDALVQTEADQTWLRTLDTCFKEKKNTISIKKTYSSIQLHRPYRVSPKSKPAPPPPPVPSRLPPPIPPPPPSRSPPQVLSFLDQDSCLSYGYTSPKSTLTLSLGSFDSSSFLPSPPSYPESMTDTKHKPKINTNNEPPGKKPRAPLPPALPPKLQAWQLFPVSKDAENYSSDEDSLPPTQEDVLYRLSPPTRPATPRQSTPRTPLEFSSSDTESSLAYSIVSLTRPPSFLFKFQKTIEVRTSWG